MRIHMNAYTYPKRHADIVGILLAYAFRDLLPAKQRHRDHHLQRQQQIAEHLLVSKHVLDVSTTASSVRKIENNNA